MLAGELLNSLIRKESHTREPKTKNDLVESIVLEK
jgi:hypothetical protein